MNRTQACLIFNPAAGQNNPEQDLLTIRALLEPEITLDIRFTTKEVDAGTIASDAIATGASTIFASGGDAQNTQNAQPSATTTPSNIVALAASSNSFTTLTSALQATGLAESLQKRGPFIVFAPLTKRLPLCLESVK